MKCDLFYTSTWIFYDKIALGKKYFSIFFLGIAWLILPQKWDITLFNHTIKINSWRVFLAICSLPEFLACAALYAFPESPRFLIFKGQYDKALNVFKKIYSFNTGKDPDTYPVIMYNNFIQKIMTYLDALLKFESSLKIFWKDLIHFEM